MAFVPDQPTKSGFVPDSTVQKVPESFTLTPGQPGVGLTRLPSFTPSSPSESDRLFSAFRQQNPGSALTSIIGRLVLESGGALAGTTPLTAGLGYSGAKNLSDALDLALGVPGSERMMQRTPLETTGESVLDVGLGAALQKGSEFAPKLAQKVLAPFERRMTPEVKSAVEVAKELGIPLFPGEVTGSPILKGTESLLSNTITSSGVMASQKETQSDILGNIADNLLKGSGSPVTKEVFGETVQAGIQREKGAFKAEAKDLYDRLASLIPEQSTVDLNNTRTIGEQFLAQQRSLPQGFGNETLVKRLENLAQSENLDFNSIRNTRTALNDYIKSSVRAGNDNEARIYSSLKEAIDQDIQGFAAAQPGNIKEAFDVANKYYAQGAQIFKDPKIKSILKANPEAVYGIVVKPNSVSDIRTLKSALGQDFGTVQRGFMDKIIEKSVGPDEAFSPVKFQKSLSKFEPETLSEVFSKDVLENINELAKASSVAGSSKGPSAVGQTLVSSAIGGVSYYNPLTGVKTLIAAPILAKFYLSKPATRYLTEGFKIPAGGKKAIELGTRIAAFTSDSVDDTSDELSDQIRRSLQ